MVLTQQLSTNRGRGRSEYRQFRTSSTFNGREVTGSDIQHYCNADAPDSAMTLSSIKAIDYIKRMKA